MLPTIQNTYADGTFQFKAGAAIALSEMAQIIGKEFTKQKLIPILLELLLEDNSEVKNNVIAGIVKVANVMGAEILNQQLLTTLTKMSMDSNWRVKMGVFKLLADLSVIFGH